MLAAAFSFGMADILVPDIFTHLFDGVDHPNPGLQGLFDSIVIILSTPCRFTLTAECCVTETFCHPPVLAAGIVASIVNLILPADEDSDKFSEEEESDNSRLSDEGRKKMEV